MKNKTTLIIVGILIIVAAVLVYFFVIKKKPDTAATATTAGSGTASGETPTLSVSNSNRTVKKGKALSFSFANFKPNDFIGVSVVNGGGITVTSDGAGDGSGALIDGDAPGQYTLQAVDSVGNTAHASFMVN